MILLVIGLLAGGAAGWVLTYAWFKRDKVRARIAGEVGAIGTRIGG